MDTFENVRGSDEDKGKNGSTVTADTETRMEISETLARSGDLGDRLLPGILGDITLSLITPKLSWSDFRMLSSVSRGWKEAIRSHLVYNERVRTHSTETFAVVLQQKSPQCCYSDYSCGIDQVFSLYSLRDKSWHELPPIAGLGEVYSLCFQCVSLDGKVYFLGGNQGRSESKELYVLDLAGQRKQWKQCASMLEPRRNFGSAIMDGKIYVFGGTDLSNPNWGPEVYDPKVDAWSWIKPMKHVRHGHEVAAVGEEIFVYGLNLLVATQHRLSFDSMAHAEVYHTVKDEWRLMESFWRNKPFGRTFSAQGKFYVLETDQLDIYVLHVEERSWTLLHSCSFPDFGRTRSLVPYAFLPVDDELVVLMYWKGFGGKSTGEGTRVLQSRGFGQEKREIVWEPIRSPQKCELWSMQTCSFLCSIQL